MKQITQLFFDGESPTLTNYCLYYYRFIYCWQLKMALTKKEANKSQL